MCAELHEIEKVAEDPRLAEIELGLVFPGVIVYDTLGAMNRSSTIVLRLRLKIFHCGT